MNVFDSVEYREIVKSCGEPVDAVVRKAYEAVTRVDDDTRTAKFVITTGIVDRMGDVIVPDGVNVEPFMRNPVVLFAHKWDAPPVGKALAVERIDNGLAADVVFADGSTDLTGLSETVYRMVRDGFLNAVSVGIMPKRIKFIRHDVPDAGDDESLVLNTEGILIEESELLEVSVVPIPANPEAIVQAKSAGIDTEPLRRFYHEALSNWKEYRKNLIVPRRYVAELVERMDKDRKSVWISFSDAELEDKLKEAKKAIVSRLLSRIEDGELIETDQKTWHMLRRQAGMTIAATAKEDDPDRLIVGKRSEIDKLRIERRTKGPISWNAAHPDGTPKAPEDEDWDGQAEIAAADVEDLLVMCAWRADKPMDELTKSDFKLPHHKASGNHAVVWRGVSAAMGALLGARGGVDIPSEDRRGVYRHLARHYREFDREPPEFRMVEQQVLRSALWEFDEEKGIPVRKDADDTVSDIQTLIFPKSKWESVEDVIEWADVHGFSHDKVDETETSWRLRQRDPDEFDDFRTVCIDPDGEEDMDACRVLAVLGIVENRNVHDVEEKRLTEETAKTENVLRPEPDVQAEEKAMNKDDDDKKKKKQSSHVRHMLMLKLHGDGDEAGAVIASVLELVQNSSDAFIKVKYEHKTELKDAEDDMDEDMDEGGDMPHEELESDMKNAPQPQIDMKERILRAIPDIVKEELKKIKGRV